MIRNDESGFTLIEVLVAFSILSLTILAGLRIFSSGLYRIIGTEEDSARLEMARAMLAHEMLGSRPQVGSALRVQLGIVRSAATTETPQWTRVKPVLVQIREGNHVLLETIVLAREANP
jgi:prepilin-type N-terminal cleavage/methylation domain-containing protein